MIGCLSIIHFRLYDQSSGDAEIQVINQAWDTVQDEVRTTIKKSLYNNFLDNFPLVYVVFLLRRFPVHGLGGLQPTLQRGLGGAQRLLPERRAWGGRRRGRGKCSILSFFFKSPHIQ